MAKIAVVGTGISSLVSAWILSQEHDVTVYEKNDYVGGHTNTRPAKFGDTTVYADTGFMVFNHKTYPNMVKMFEYLGVETIQTDMAFGITANGGEFEFSSDNVFIQKKRFFSMSYWKMLRDITRFNSTVQDVVAKHEDEFPLGELLKEMKMGEMFQKDYLLPMAGAIWSTEKGNMLEYPAKQFVSFFDNHGLLSPKSLNPLTINQGRLQWYTVKGGAQEYVRKICDRMDADIRLSCGVRSVVRKDGKVIVQDTNGESEMYDKVVFGSHPDQTLAMLQDPSKEESENLGVFVYTKNDTYMHKDTSFMMKHTTDWPSWTYAEPQKSEVELSYYMNRLQSIDKTMPVVVTLNPSHHISPDDTFYHTVYEHPRFSVGTYAAQKNIQNIQGAQNTWFVGAWLGHGFHEDGLSSALQVVKQMNVSVPWE